MQQLLLILHVVVCIFLIALVLIQHGKGADAGAAFGSGASQTIFGSQGAGSFLMKVTCGLAALFFITCLVLGYMAVQESKPAGTLMTLPAPSPKTNNTNVPIVPVTPTNPASVENSNVPDVGTDKNAAAVVPVVPIIQPNKNAPQTHTAQNETNNKSKNASTD